MAFVDTDMDLSFIFDYISYSSGIWISNSSSISQPLLLTDKNEVSYSIEQADDENGEFTTACFQLRDEATWTAFGNWGQCSVNCGTGIRVRKAKCTDRAGKLWTECLHNGEKLWEKTETIQCTQETDCNT